MSIYQIVVKGRFLGVTELRNIHHYEHAAGVPSVSELQEFVDTIDNDYKTALQGLLANDVEVYAYDVRRVDVGDQPTIEYQATAGAWSGTSAFDVLPGQLSALVSWKALTAYPRSARSYIFPMTEDNNSSGGQVSAAAVTALETLASDLLQLVIVGPKEMDKVSVQYSGTPRVVSASNVVTTYKVAKEWATQRRRRKGVGV